MRPVLAVRYMAWKNQLDAQTRRIVLENDRTTMQFHDTCHETQSQAIARLAAAFVETHETLEHPLAVGFRECPARGPTR